MNKKPNPLDFIKLVYHIYNTRYAPKFDYMQDDLISEGFLGILEGIEAYEKHNHEYSITTYVYKNIHKNMWKLIDKEAKINTLNTSADTIVDERDEDTLLSMLEDTEQSAPFDNLEDKIDLENAINKIKKEEYRKILKHHSLGLSCSEYDPSKTGENTRIKLKIALKKLKENYLHENN
jgi:RNA polymerase sigma factor (sigma-70 family)